MFFDLSIPYLERDHSDASENRSLLKDARRKAVARAMELGYSAVAYDRPFRGVLCDSDRCKIPPFPASSLLSSPSLTSASFHRDLLRAPRSSPFRQYTRLTVSVDGRAAAAALKSGNPLLRTYDLVAARPVTQIGFDQACQVSEVDIISLDFSQKIPFRLKLPMVEAAIKRGVHFEISYSHLIADVHVRRQMLSDAKLLVDWTRGKNLIISSSATNVIEVRGPYDVANLSSFLLGLSMEQAKSAISGNCRSLVANALRKKDYKEAIRIERILPDGQEDASGIWFGDWKDWDPISSGDGDLPPLDDIAKLFSTASKPSKHYPAIDFFSCANGLPSKDQISGIGENLPLQGKCGALTPYPSNPGLAAACKVLSSSNNEAKQKDRLDEVRVEYRTSSAMMPLQQQISGCEGDQVSRSDMTRLFADHPKEPAPPVADYGHLQSANENTMVSDAAGMPSSNLAVKHHIFTSETKNAETLRASNVPSQNDTVGPAPSEGADVIPLTHDVSLEESHNGIKEKERGRVVSVENDAPMKDVSIETEEQRKLESGAAAGVILHMHKSGETVSDEVSRACYVPSEKDTVGPAPSEGGCALLDNEAPGESYVEIKDHEHGKVVSVENDAPMMDVSSKMEERRQQGTGAANDVILHMLKSGKGLPKGRSLRPAYPMPFKGLFRTVLFKKKVHRLRR